MQAIAPSATRASTQRPTPISARAMSSSSAGGGRASGKSAAFNGRRAMHAVGGGGPKGSTQRLSLSTYPLPQTGGAVPAPAPLLTASVNVEASVAVPFSSSSSAAQSMDGNGLKMTLLQAVSILGADAFKRLATCEEGSEQMTSLQRLLELLPQVRSTSVHALASMSL
jgi:hypothetical protein